MKESISFNEQSLNSFASKQWNKVLSYLQGQFNLPQADCEDIFQDSFIVLYHQVVEGKLTEMTASLSTYFVSICRNKAMEHMREKSKTVLLEDQFPQTSDDTFIDEQIDKLLSYDTSDEDIAIEKRKQSLVRQIVRDLPSPCNELLWAFYRDGFSMKTMAEMFHYKSESAAKVTKHRCTEKFRARFEDLVHKLF